MSELGRRLRELRQQGDLTLREAAHQAKIDFSVLSRFETGQAQPEVTTLHRLAAVLGGDVDTLLPLLDRRTKDDLRAELDAARAQALCYAEDVAQLNAHVSIQEATITRLEAERDALREVVEYYAERDAWPCVPDCNDRAKQVLAQFSQNARNE